MTITIKKKHLNCSKHLYLLASEFPGNTYPNRWMAEDGQFTNPHSHLLTTQYILSYGVLKKSIIYTVPIHIITFFCERINNNFDSIHNTHRILDHVQQSVKSALLLNKILIVDLL